MAKLEQGDVNLVLVQLRLDNDTLRQRVYKLEGKLSKAVARNVSLCAEIAEVCDMLNMCRQVNAVAAAIGVAEDKG